MSMFQSIRAKMLMAFFVTSVGVGVVAWQGVSSVEDVAEHLDEVSGVLLPSVTALGEMRQGIDGVRIQSRAAILGGRANDKERIRDAKNKREGFFAQIEKGRAAYDKLPMKEAEKAPWAKSTAAFAGYKAANDDVFERVDAGEIDKADELMKTVANAAVRQFAEPIQEISEFNAGQAVLEAKAGNEAKASAGRNMLIFGVIAALGSMGLGVILTQMITGPLNKVTQAAAGIALGDIDQTIDHRSADETGQLAESFRNLIDYVKGIANAADGMSRGDLTIKVTAKSDADVLSKNFIANTDAVKALVAEMQTLITAAKAGALSTRGDARRFQGSYAELVVGVNQLIEAIVQPVNEASSVLERVADRDLTARMTGEYKGDFAKIKTSLNQAVENLHDGMSSISIAVEQVASASAQIASSSQSVAQGASEQARSIEETSSSLTQMAAMTTASAKSALVANELASNAKTTSDQGAQSMGKMSEAMGKIRASAEGTAAIIRDINEIAFQTNLLALNAAVEAARAGEAGRGFAVVAEEVRNLALRSKEAAKKTESLINDSVQLAQSGENVSKTVSTNLSDIIGLATKVSNIIGEITVASTEQQKGIESVVGAVGKMDRVTQQNAASSEESSSAAQELSGQAQEMTVLVGQFKLDRASNPVTPKAKARAQQARGGAKALPAPRSAGGKNGNGKPAIPFDEDPIFSEF